MGQPEGEQTDGLLGVTEQMAAASLILVVDADLMFGLMLEACLDFEGARVETVGSLAEARAAIRPELGGLVVERDLPDGDGVDLLEVVADRCPALRVVVCGEVGAVPEPERAQWPAARVDWVAKADLARITELLGLEPEHDHLPSDRLLHISALDLRDDADTTEAQPELG
jgi:ActR/RegA family two-component response regulator